jgi:steroid delta-isomerase-like uncharacterized protein
MLLLLEDWIRKGGISMPAEENNQLVRRTFEEAWNRGELNTVYEIFDARHVSHGVGVELPDGPDGFKQLIAVYRAAYPDIHFTVEDQLAEGDKVAIRWSATGTHEGELMGIAPTGKQVTLTGMAISRIVDGKIMETWNSFDALGQLQQLGVIPAAGQGGDAAGKWPSI